MSTAASAHDRPRRWDSPFTDDLTDADIASLLARAPFASMKADNFPRSSPLPDVLKNDTRIRRDH